jgi:YVTN family beta-propeller protein
MKRLLWLPVLWLIVCGNVAAQTPQATDLPGKPFFIKKTWTIGGEGNWDYLTLDPVALQLYIAHGHAVQVVDVNAGSVSGEVTGLREAHGIALDSDGQFGYVSDGPANEVKVFDRRSLEVVASIPTGRNPRAVVFEPASRLVFAICPDVPQESVIPRRAGNVHGFDPSVKSTVTVIDAETRTPLADLMLPGRLGFAQTDGNGMVYVNITDRNQIAYFNAQDFDSRLRRLTEKPEPDGSKLKAASPALAIDWSSAASSHEAPPIPSPLRFLHLGQECLSPSALAVDGNNLRIFAACDNMKMQVLNAQTGQIVTTLPIGAGTDAVGYDKDRGLIYTSNGGGVGSLTIIRRNLTDSYAVIQELPTQARARTLAVNPVTGEVYLVTNVMGFDLTHKGSVGNLKTAAVAGSFQVLVVGN